MKPTILRAALLGAFVCGFAASPARAEKYAVLVGVTEMLNVPKDNWLSGPANDVPMMKDFLTAFYGFKEENMRVLIGKDSTRAGIERAFRENLIAKAQPGDTVVFYYSGHGTQVPDQNGDEADGKDEAICPMDCGGTIQSYVTDDDFATWLGQLKTKDAFIMLDSCHSGTGMRGGEVSRGLNAKVAGLDASKFPAPTKEEQNERADTMAPDGITPILLSGCRSDQTSADTRLLMPDDPKLQAQYVEQVKANGKYCVGQPINPWTGALTFATVATLIGDPNQSYAQAHKSLSLWLQKLKYDQEPQLEGAENRPMFGGSVLPATATTTAVNTAPAPPVETTTPVVVAPPVVETPPVATTTTVVETATAPVSAAGATTQVTSVAGDAAEISVAPGVELVVGSIFESGNGAASLRVTNVRGQNGSARILRGKVSAGDRLRESFHFIATKKLRVTVMGSAPGNAKSEISKRLGALDFVEVVDGALPHDAELELATRGDGLRVNMYRNQQGLPPIAGADADEVFPKIGRALENLYTVNQLVALDNPSAKLRVDLLVNGEDFNTVKIGDSISFTARADQDCYLYLLDVDAAGKVAVLFPNKYVADNKLRAGQTTNLPAPALFRLRVTGPSGGEAVKAIVTTAPLNLEVLNAANGEMTALAGGGASVAGELLGQLKREINGGARGIEVLAGDPRQQPISTEGWGTDIVLLTIKD